MGKKLTDEEIFEKVGISRKDHENRNQFNELPTGLMKKSEHDKTLYIDEAGRQWKRNADFYASYHQPFPVWVAGARSILAKFLFLKCCRVPNLKFISQNEDKTYSEVCCNRKTGEVLVEPQILGTYNFCTDEGEAMKTGNLPNGGVHEKKDIIPHKEYGGNYKHLAKDIPVSNFEVTGAAIPVILDVSSKK